MLWRKSIQEMLSIEINIEIIANRKENMDTTVYLIRHSEKLDTKYIDKYYNDEFYQITREKRILSSEGERKAKILSENKEFNKLDAIYSSNYVRAIQTAKYFAERLDIKINVNKDLNERRYGNPLESKDIVIEQYYDENIKNNDGESRKEVTERMYNVFKNIVRENKGKNIAIFSHGASITFLLMKWCDLISITNEKKKCLKFKNNIIANKIFGAPEVFKIIINENGSIKSIENLEIKEEREKFKNY